jgi:hypothetical protein
MMKNLLKHLTIRFLKFVAPLFFHSHFLKGKHFEQSTKGWRWVMNALWFQKILGFNRSVPWPISPYIKIANPENLIFDLDDLNNFQSFGCYYQNFGAKIYLGKGTYIAPNVGLITTNHDPMNPDHHLPGKDIHIGKSCWIGMNAVILPGVVLGDYTTVAAGAVVTKSFPEGYTILAGVPARVIKNLKEV